MDLRQTLSKRHSKELTEIIADRIAKDPDELDILIGLMEDEDKMLSQRAAWPLSLVAEKSPELIIPHVARLTELLGKKGYHDAVNRNIVRAFQFVDIPDDDSGIVIDKCFDLLNDRGQPIAVQVFSMQVISNLTERYPELKNELKVSIESQWDTQSAGFRSRGKRILKKIESL